MASTSQMIDWVAMNANGWDRSGVRGILPILNEVHRILFQNEIEQTMKFDASEGNFPSIPTIAGVFEYELPEEVWRVSELLLEYPIFEDYGFINLFDDYGYLRHLRRLEEKVYFYKRYARLPNVSTIDATRTSPAKLRFHDDPGEKIVTRSSGTNDSTATNKLVDSGATFITDGVKVGNGVINNTGKVIAFVTALDSETQLSLDRDIFTSTSQAYIVGPSPLFYRAYIKPNDLISEQVEMNGSEEVHLKIVLPATIAAIEAFENGGWDAVFSILDREYVPKMIEHQNSGDQGLTYYAARYEA